MVRKIELLTRRARKHRPDTSNTVSSSKKAMTIFPIAPASKPRC